MRGHSAAWYTNIENAFNAEDPPAKETDPMSPHYIPVDGSAKSDPVKAFKYRSAPVVAPDQGFEGPDVAHSHMETATADWNTEYGPQAWWLHKPAKAGARNNFVSIGLGAGLLLLIN